MSNSTLYTFIHINISISIVSSELKMTFFYNSDNVVMFIYIQQIVYL